MSRRLLPSLPSGAAHRARRPARLSSAQRSTASLFTARGQYRSREAARHDDGRHRRARRTPRGVSPPALRAQPDSERPLLSAPNSDQIIPSSVVDHGSVHPFASFTVCPASDSTTFLDPRHARYGHIHRAEQWAGDAVGFNPGADAGKPGPHRWPPAERDGAPPPSRVAPLVRRRRGARRAPSRPPHDDQTCAGRGTPGRGGGRVGEAKPSPCWQSVRRCRRMRAARHP